MVAWQEKGVAGYLLLSLETGGIMRRCAWVETGRAGCPADIPQSPVLGLLRYILAIGSCEGVPLQETEGQKGHTMIDTFRSHNLQTVGHPFL